MVFRVWAFFFPFFCASDGRDLKDCTFPKDIKKFLVDVHDFSVELIGEDIFPLFQRNVTVSITLFYCSAVQCNAQVSVF